MKYALNGCHFTVDVLEMGEILHIFPLAPKVWGQGIQKGLHGSEDRYIPADQIRF